MAYHKSQNEWRKENAVTVSFQYSRISDKELYDMFINAESKSGLARELILDGLKYRRQALDLLPEK